MMKSARPRRGYNRSEKTHVCNVCGRAYVSRDALNAHSGSRRCRRRELIKCPSCSRSFGSKWGLEYHFLVFHKQQVATVTTANHHQPGSIVGQGSRTKIEQYKNEVDDLDQNDQEYDNSQNGFVSAANSNRKIVKVAPSSKLYPVSNGGPQQQYFVHRNNSTATETNAPVASTSAWTSSSTETSPYNNGGPSCSSKTSCSVPNKQNLICPEPIGDLILCHICQEKFYHPLYLSQHVRYEHKKVVKDILNKNHHRGKFGRDPGPASFQGSGQLKDEGCDRTGTTMERKLGNFQVPMTVKKKDEKFQEEMPILRCQRCFKTFGNKEKLNTHMKLHIRHQECFCNICGKHFVQFTQLKNHVATMHPSPGLNTLKSTDTDGRGRELGNGGNDFDGKNQDYDESEDDTDDDYDDVSEEEDDKINDEDNSQGQNKGLSCFLCDFTSLTHYSMEEHVLSSHSNIENGRFACPDCEFLADDAVNLLTHIRHHDGEKSHQSQQCSKIRTDQVKSFDDVTYCKAGKFPCGICSNSYRHKNSLKRHLRQAH